MTTTDALLVTGYLLLFAAVTMASISARYYVRQNIAGVRDDLSGRKRQRDILNESTPCAKDGSFASDVSDASQRRCDDLTTMMEEDMSDREYAAWTSGVATVVEVGRKQPFVVTYDVVVASCGELTAMGSAA